MNNGDEFKKFSVVNETLEDLPWLKTTTEERALIRIAINLAEIADQLAEMNGYVVAHRYDADDIEQAKKLWEQFEDVPMNPETECIESDWKGFPIGTNREEIWHWFEEQFNISVAKDLMGVG